MFGTKEKMSNFQQQFQDWTQFEQLYFVVELTRTFQLSSRYFLSQLFQKNIQCEKNDMFNHIVDDANSPDIVTCLLSNTLDKIISTLQLYLPLISTALINEKLLDSYRKVLIYLDENLLNPNKFTCTQQQIIDFSQYILFFVQTNPNLQNLANHIPQLINLVQRNQFQYQEQNYYQNLQRFGSNRSQIQPLMNISSNNSHNLTLNQQLKRLEINDSGVDLTEPPMSTFLSSNNATPLQRTHVFVSKTVSSPTFDHASNNVQTHTPLKYVASAPPDTIYSNCQQQKHTPTLSKSDEDEQESQKQFDDSKDFSKPLTQFYSVNFQNPQSHRNGNVISQYLGVDANSASKRNTFEQANSGMRDVRNWLRHLRLHKYDEFFSQITYDEMMNLTREQLKKYNITDGACKRILLNIQMLKERSSFLKKLLIDIEQGQIDLLTVIQQLYELMITPIRSKQLENDNNSDEDLPKLIIQILNKINQQITPNSSSEICGNLLDLCDRCYRHGAFTVDQRHYLLQWRGSLRKYLQSIAANEQIPNQLLLHFSLQQRRPVKPPVKPIKSATPAYYPNHSSNAIPFDKYNSEPPQNNLFEQNSFRRSIKFPTKEENDINNNNLQTPALQRNNSSYLVNNQHQALTRKSSIDQYGETNRNNKTKLCKTFSDPNRNNSTPLSTIRSQQTQKSNLLRFLTPSYSQQPFISQSPPTATKPCFSDNEQSDHYENIDDQPQNQSDFESFCRQITETVINEDVNDVSINQNTQIPTNSTDIEQW